MNEYVVTLSEDGTVRFLVNEDTKPFIDEDAVIRRASHVEPKNVLIRLTFHILRGIFGEKGWMAEFTRRWPCKWRINLSPINGPILPGLYKDRQEAIREEIKYLNSNFI
jgi:hypothetical protein